MSEWYWMTVAYVIAYGSLAVLVASISARIRSARSRLDTLAAEDPT